MTRVTESRVMSHCLAILRLSPFLGFLL